MAGLLTNGTYVLVPEQEPDYEKLYDYAMFDDNGNPVAGVKYGPITSGTTNVFRGCSGTELRIYDDKLTNAANGMFSGCSALRSIPDNSFNSVTTATWMFHNCRSLTAIPSNSFNSVTVANNMFTSATSLTSIGENCLTNLTSGSYIFLCCSALPELPDNFLNNLSAGGSQLFYRCFSLSSIPKNSFNNITGMNQTFNGCSGLVDISNLTSCFAKATSATAAFPQCSAVTSELIPIIDYFRTKTPPLSAGSAHLFSACNKAADYATCTASPVYSGWVK